MLISAAVLFRLMSDINVIWGGVLTVTIGAVLGVGCERDICENFHPLSTLSSGEIDVGPQIWITF